MKAKPICLVCKKKYIVRKGKTYGFHQRKDGPIELCKFEDGITRPGQMISKLYSREPQRQQIRTFNLCRKKITAHGPEGITWQSLARHT